MVNRTKSLDESTMVSLLSELATLSQAAKNVREKLLKIVPVKYGSDLWWEKEEKKGLQEYKEGKFKTFASVKDLMKDLNS